MFLMGNLYSQFKESQTKGKDTTTNFLRTGKKKKKRHKANDPTKTPNGMHFKLCKIRL